MLTDERGRQLDELLGLSIAEIDIPEATYRRAVARYEAVATWLADSWPGQAAGEIYPQGSFRLGTVVRPITPNGEYDVDLVCRRDLPKQSTTQRALKDDVGDGLYAYAQAGGDVAPSVREGKRCWTLEYPGEPYHMDILPALPNPEGKADEILLTDRDLGQWQLSNPIAYAAWFRATMREERALLLKEAATARRVDIESVPENVIKTTLQRTVQALKRHRDLHFVGSPEDAPASIIITTLAARAYRGGGTLHAVLLDITARMGELVEDRAGVFWVPNPVLPAENFADRWRSHPKRASRFFDWVEQAQADFADIGADLGVDRMIEKMADSFGAEPARRAGERLGQRMQGQRNAGLLRMNAAGLLGLSGGRPVKEHTFHGDAPPPAGP